MFLVCACRVKRMLSNEACFERIRSVFEGLSPEINEIFDPVEFHFVKKQSSSAKTSRFQLQLII